MPFRVVVNENYPKELKERLAQHEISYGELAREMKSSVPQISRWINKPMVPSVHNIMRIEAAIMAILHSRKRQRKRKPSAEPESINWLYVAAPARSEEHVGQVAENEGSGIRT
jgi:transcriptional regulator with XRE-family HTH domain